MARPRRKAAAVTLAKIAATATSGDGNTSTSSINDGISPAPEEEANTEDKEAEETKISAELVDKPVEEVIQDPVATESSTATNTRRGLRRTTRRSTSPHIEKQEEMEQQQGGKTSKETTKKASTATKKKGGTKADGTKADSGKGKRGPRKRGRPPKQKDTVDSLAQLPLPSEGDELQELDKVGNPSAAGTDQDRSGTKVSRKGQLQGKRTQPSSTDPTSESQPAVASDTIGTNETPAEDTTLRRSKRRRAVAWSAKHRDEEISKTPPKENSLPLAEPVLQQSESTSAQEDLAAVMILALASAPVSASSGKTEEVPNTRGTENETQTPLLSNATSSSPQPQQVSKSETFSTNKIISATADTSAQDGSVPRPDHLAPQSSTSLDSKDFASATAEVAAILTALPDSCTPTGSSTRTIASSDCDPPASSIDMKEQEKETTSDVEGLENENQSIPNVTGQENEKEAMPNVEPPEKEKEAIPDVEDEKENEVIPKPTTTSSVATNTDEAEKPSEATDPPPDKVIRYDVLPSDKVDERDEKSLPKEPSSDGEEGKAVNDTHPAAETSALKSETEEKIGEPTVSASSTTAENKEDALVKTPTENKPEEEENPQPDLEIDASSAHPKPPEIPPSHETSIGEKTHESESVKSVSKSAEIKLDLASPVHAEAEAPVDALSVKSQEHEGNDEKTPENDLMSVVKEDEPAPRVDIEANVSDSKDKPPNADVAITAESGSENTGESSIHIDKDSGADDRLDSAESPEQDGSGSNRGLDIKTCEARSDEIEENTSNDGLRRAVDVSEEVSAEHIEGSTQGVSVPIKEQEAADDFSSKQGGEHLGSSESIPNSDDVETEPKAETHTEEAENTTSLEVRTDADEAPVEKNEERKQKSDVSGERVSDASKAGSDKEDNVSMDDPNSSEIQPLDAHNSTPVVYSDEAQVESSDIVVHSSPDKVEDNTERDVDVSRHDGDSRQKPETSEERISLNKDEVLSEGSATKEEADRATVLSEQDSVGNAVDPGKSSPLADKPTQDSDVSKAMLISGPMDKGTQEQADLEEKRLCDAETIPSNEVDAHSSEVSVPIHPLGEVHHDDLEKSTESGKQSKSMTTVGESEGELARSSAGVASDEPETVVGGSLSADNATVGVSFSNVPDSGQNDTATSEKVDGSISEKQSDEKGVPSGGENDVTSDGVEADTQTKPEHPLDNDAVEILEEEHDASGKDEKRTNMEESASDAVKENSKEDTDGLAAESVSGKVGVQSDHESATTCVESLTEQTDQEQSRQMGNSKIPRSPDEVPQSSKPIQAKEGQNMEDLVKISDVARGAKSSEEPEDVIEGKGEVVRSGEDLDIEDEGNIASFEENETLKCSLSLDSRVGVSATAIVSDLQEAGNIRVCGASEHAQSVPVVDDSTVEDFPKTDELSKADAAKDESTELSTETTLLTPTAIPVETIKSLSHETGQMEPTLSTQTETDRDPTTTMETPLSDGEPPKMPTKNAFPEMSKDQVSVDSVHAPKENNENSNKYEADTLPAATESAHDKNAVVEAGEKTEDNAAQEGEAKRNSTRMEVTEKGESLAELHTSNTGSESRVVEKHGTDDSAMIKDAEIDAVDVSEDSVRASIKDNIVLPKEEVDSSSGQQRTKPREESNLHTESKKDETKSAEIPAGLITSRFAGEDDDNDKVSHIDTSQAHEQDVLKTTEGSSVKPSLSSKESAESALPSPGDQEKSLKPEAEVVVTTTTSPHIHDGSGAACGAITQASGLAPGIEIQSSMSDRLDSSQIHKPDEDVGGDTAGAERSPNLSGTSDHSEEKKHASALGSRLSPDGPRHISTSVEVESGQPDPPRGEADGSEVKEVVTKDTSLSESIRDCRVSDMEKPITLTGTASVQESSPPETTKDSEDMNMAVPGSSVQAPEISDPTGKQATEKADTTNVNIAPSLAVAEAKPNESPETKEALKHLASDTKETESVLDPDSAEDGSKQPEVPESGSGPPFQSKSIARDPQEHKEISTISVDSSSDNVGQLPSGGDETSPLKSVPKFSETGDAQRSIPDSSGVATGKTNPQVSKRNDQLISDMKGEKEVATSTSILATDSGEAPSSLTTAHAKSQKQLESMTNQPSEVDKAAPSQELKESVPQTKAEPTDTNLGSDTSQPTKPEEGNTSSLHVTCTETKIEESRGAVEEASKASEKILDESKQNHEIIAKKMDGAKSPEQNKNKSNEIQQRKRKLTESYLSQFPLKRFKSHVKQESDGSPSSNDFEQTKLRIYTEGSVVHGVDDYDRKFARYWDSMRMRFDGGNTPNVIEKSRSAINGFLKTKKLRKLHNKLVKGLLRQCLRLRVPFHEISPHLPHTWRNRIRVCTRDDAQSTSNKTKEVGRVGKQGYLPTFGGPPSFPQKVKRPNNSSLRIPGALSIDPTVRTTAHAANMKVSEDAVWLMIISAKEYARTVLNGCVALKTCTHRGKLKRPLPMGSGSGRPSKVNKKDSSIDLPLNERSIRPIDVRCYVASLQAKGLHLQGSTVSRTAGERTMIASAEMSLVPYGRAFYKIKDFMHSKLAPSSSTPIHFVKDSLGSSEGHRPQLGGGGGLGLGRGAKDLSAMKKRTSTTKQEGDSLTDMSERGSESSRQSRQAGTQDLGGQPLQPGGVVPGSSRPVQSTSASSASLRGTNQPASAAHAPVPEEKQEVAASGRGKGYGIKDLAAMRARTTSGQKDED